MAPKQRLNPQTPAVTDPDLLRDADYQLTPEQEDDSEPEETVIHEDDKNVVVRLADGTEEVRDAKKDERSPKTKFYENLAPRLDRAERETLALELLDLIERDLKSREKRDEQYAEGIRRTGLGDDAPGGATFNGASRVVHPALAEACVDFSARAIKELFPPAGPVRSKIIGKQTPEKLKRAERKVQHMNFQLTQEIREYRSELEQLLTQLPLGGSQYLKLYWDPRLKRARAEFLPIDDVILPYSAGEFYSSQRKTQRLYLTEVEYSDRVDSGVYWEATEDTPKAPSHEPEESKAAEATHKIEGKERTYYNEDGLRVNYESYVLWSLPDSIDGGKRRPYLVMLDESSYDVKGVYRNWDEDDDTATELHWIVDFTFIPWRGAQGVGLPHLIGGMSGAATGALRALLDTAHINNSATLIKLKSNQGAQNVNIDITGVTEVEGRAGVDDIRKMAMPLPFNPPSQVLYQLLDWLTIQMKGVVSTAEEKIADATNTMPVGTAMALIEQGSQVFSAIHMRLHASQHMALQILHRINRTHLDDEQTIAELGELIVRREDYEGPADVIPVSDPNIFSETQRFAQVQALRGASAEAPDVYNRYAVEKRFLEAMKVPDPDAILLPHYEAENVDPVEENVRMGLGRPVEAYPEQDHIAHLNEHISFMADPIFGQSLLIAPSLIQGMIGHAREHLLLWYKQSLQRVVIKAAGVEDFEELEEDTSTEARNAVARTLALAGMLFHDHNRTPVPNVVQAVIPQLMKLGQVAQQALQLLQPLMQAGQPQDPAVAVAQADVQRKAAKDKQDGQLEAQRIQQDGQSKQADAQVRMAETQRRAQRDQQDGQLGALEIATRKQMAQSSDASRERTGARRDQTARDNMATRERMNTADNTTAVTIVAAEIDSGERSNLKTGTGINP